MTEAPKVVLGQPMDDEQKRQMAKFNAEESAKAHELAAQHKARDLEAGGHGAPTVVAVADMLKKKLENNEILPPEAGTTSRTTPQE